MRNWRSIILLSILTAVLAAIAAAVGIFYNFEGEPYIYKSIRGQDVEIYGRGLYHHMSSEVAVQGIAHDYVTLFLAVPALLVSTYLLQKRVSLRRILVHAGILKFLFLTYLFYTNMAMYNTLFLLYVVLTGISFFALILSLLQVDMRTLKSKFLTGLPEKFIGGFLIFLSLAIAFLWLEVIITPLMDGTIIPVSVEHYTSLTVQGLDLAIFLPVAFVAGMLLLKKKTFGYLMASVTLVFLCFLLSALVAKIIAMSMAGANVVPVIFIIPTFLLLALICAFLMFRKIGPGALA